MRRLAGHLGAYDARSLGGRACSRRADRRTPRRGAGLRRMLTPERGFSSPRTLSCGCPTISLVASRLQSDPERPVLHIEGLEGRAGPHDRDYYLWITDNAAPPLMIPYPSRGSQPLPSAGVAVSRNNARNQAGLRCRAASTLRSAATTPPAKPQAADVPVPVSDRSSASQKWLGAQRSGL